MAANQATGGPNEPSTTGASRKRPRHSPGAPAEEAVRQLPPVLRLYRHALESIFGFLSLKELSKVLAVSRSWSAAVVSMRSIAAAAPDLKGSCWSPFELSASRLARHIGAVGLARTGSRIGLTHDHLYLVGLRMTGLHSLYCEILPNGEGPLIFPPSLTFLDVHPPGPDSMELQRLMVAISCLSKLASLTLTLPCTYLLCAMSFAPLQPLTELSYLAMDKFLTSQNYDELSALPNLTELDMPLRRDDLLELSRSVSYQQGTVRWQKLHTFCPLEPDLLAVLVGLPSLTSLRVAKEGKLTFLQSLPNLRSLIFEPGHKLRSPERMAFHLAQFRSDQLTFLCIADCAATDLHVRALLGCLPSVQRLGLLGLDALKSLAFLSAEPLVHTLTHFQLEGGADGMPASEFIHVFALKQLATLQIDWCAREDLDSLTRLLLKAPSSQLPNLVHSTVH